MLRWPVRRINEGTEPARSTQCWRYNVELSLESPVTERKWHNAEALQTRSKHCRCSSTTWSELVEKGIFIGRRKSLHFCVSRVPDGTSRCPQQFIMAYYTLYLLNFRFRNNPYKISYGRILFVHYLYDTRLEPEIDRWYTQFLLFTCPAKCKSTISLHLLSYLNSLPERDRTRDISVFAHLNNSMSLQVWYETVSQT